MDPGISDVNTGAIHPLSIGNVVLENNLGLAPMAGVSDPPFRLLCREQGAGLVCMEMISAKALCYRNKKTEDLARVEPSEHPVSLQLFGSDPEAMAEAVSLIDRKPFDILDINMGCPVPKIVKGGDGSALMKDPKLARKIVCACVRKSTKPVTVKIRAGFDAEHINAVEIAKAAEQAGASAVAVHGRTREQMYSGKADWEIIRRVKEAVSIPVFGNGDIDSPGAVLSMYEQTGCDGFLIGRAAQGNPWIFGWILRELGFAKGSGLEEGLTFGGEQGTDLNTGNAAVSDSHGAPGDVRKIAYPPPYEEVCRMILRHARMQIEARGEYVGMRQMRKHASWYISGYPGAARLREALNNITTIEELEDILRLR